MNTHFPDPKLPPIVILDDSDDDIFLLRLRLRDGGITHPILTFHAPVEAETYLETARLRGALPALMFVDIKMPGCCGFEFIAKVRESIAWDEMPIVVATASNQPADLERALEVGVNGYLIKFPPADLLADFVRNGPWFAVPRGTHPVEHALSA
jgi:CheY-like chemotaxis protein